MPVLLAGAYRHYCLCRGTTVNINTAVPGCKKTQNKRGLPRGCLRTFCVYVCTYIRYPLGIYQVLSLFMYTWVRGRVPHTSYTNIRQDTRSTHPLGRFFIFPSWLFSTKKGRVQTPSGSLAPAASLSLFVRTIYIRYSYAVLIIVEGTLSEFHLRVCAITGDHTAVLIVNRTYGTHTKPTRYLVYIYIFLLLIQTTIFGPTIYTMVLRDIML